MAQARETSILLLSYGCGAISWTPCSGGVTPHCCCKAKEGSIKDDRTHGPMVLDTHVLYDPTAACIPCTWGDFGGSGCAYSLLTTSCQLPTPGFGLGAWFYPMCSQVTLKEYLTNLPRIPGCFGPSWFP